MGAAIIGVAPQAQAEKDCGAMGKGEVYIISGEDLNCETAVYVVSKNMDGASVPLWTCQVDRFRGWCTSPPNLRIEVR
jgi:hypothetical protein